MKPTPAQKRFLKAITDAGGVKLHYSSWPRGRPHYDFVGRARDAGWVVLHYGNDRHSHWPYSPADSYQITNSGRLAIGLPSLA